MAGHGRRGEPPGCVPGSPAPRADPWDTGGVVSGDGWNRGYAHPLAEVLPEDVRGINWGCRCPVCGTSFRTTIGTEADALMPDAVPH